MTKEDVRTFPEKWMAWLKVIGGGAAVLAFIGAVIFWFFSDHDQRQLTAYKETIASLETQQRVTQAEVIVLRAENERLSKAFEEIRAENTALRVKTDMTAILSELAKQNEHREKHYTSVNRQQELIIQTQKETVELLREMRTELSSR